MSDESPKGRTRQPGSAKDREFRGKRYSFDETAPTPFLEIDGKPIMVERTDDGRFESHHEFFRPYESLEEMAQDLILFSPQFKALLKPQPQDKPPDHGGHGGHDGGHGPHDH